MKLIINKDDTSVNFRGLMTKINGVRIFIPKSYILNFKIENDSGIIEINDWFYNTYVVKLLNADIHMALTN